MANDPMWRQSLIVVLAASCGRDATDVPPTAQIPAVQQRSPENRTGPTPELIALRDELERSRLEPGAPTWVGTYSDGDFWTRESLTLGADRRFVHASSGCISNHLCAGRFRVDGDSLRLEEVSDEDLAESFRGLARAMYFVTYGEQRLVCTRSQVIDNCNEVNQGAEPSFGLTRDRSRASSSRAALTVPADFRAFLLDRPIVAHVVRVDSIETIEDAGESLSHGRCAIDAGSADRVLVGMTFLIDSQPASGRSFTDEYVVTTVEAHSANLTGRNVVDKLRAVPRIGDLAATRFE